MKYEDFLLKGASRSGRVVGGEGGDEGGGDEGGGQAGRPASHEASAPGIFEYFVETIIYLSKICNEKFENISTLRTIARVDSLDCFEQQYHSRTW